MNKYIKYIKKIPEDINVIFKYKKQIKYQNNKYRVKTGEDLRIFHNIAEGKRCFIIGNGPSLTLDDLDSLQNEITFASNGIFNIFDKVNWRPTYYFLGDPHYAQYVQEAILKPIQASMYTFLIYTHLEKYNKLVLDFNNVYFYKQPYRTIFDSLEDKIVRGNRPRFSKDITKCMYSAGTITYEMLQMAIYMGFSEIYLIGLDHSYRFGSHFDGCDDMYTKGPEKLTKWDYAYEECKRHAEYRGIKIYNVTRGGYLETFERKNFDDIKK